MSFLRPHSQGSLMCLPHHGAAGVILSLLLQFAVACCKPQEVKILALTLPGFATLDTEPLSPFCA